MSRFRSWALVLGLLLALASAVQAARPMASTSEIGDLEKRRPRPKPKPKPPKQLFKSPLGFFIQERASKMLPGPGQHFQFGALRPWEEILQYVDSTPNTKLMLIVRHGQAISNWLSDALGPDEAFKVAGECSYTDGNGTTWGVFDADLTEFGKDQGRYVNSILGGGGWLKKMSGNLSMRAIVSPLSRVIETAMLVSQGLGIKNWSVEEYVRETLGADTCDARRSVSDPDPHRPIPSGPCKFEQGLASRFPQFKFPIVGAGGAKGLGLVSDDDILWTQERETQMEQIYRATKFLYNVFEFAPEKVQLVFSHSGFARSILLAVGREPYRPQNTEIVPVIISQIEEDEDDYDDDDDVRKAGKHSNDDDEDGDDEEEEEEERDEE